MKKRLLALVLAVAMLMTQAAISFTAVAAEETQPADDSYDVVVGDVRVQLLSDTLARVEVKGPKGFEDRETYHVVGRDWEGTPYTVSTSGDLQVISTEKYNVYVPAGASSLDGVYMTDADGKVIWAYTTLPEKPDYLPDPGDTPKAWAIADTPRVVPAEWGYDVLPAGETDNGYNGWDVDNDAPDMYIFVPLNDAKQLRADFVALTGSSEMVPLKALGLWYSCFRAFSEQGAVDYVQEYRDRGFPLDYFVMDTDWRTGGSHGYNVNTSLLPDIERFFDRMHNEANVNVVFNDHPEAQNNMHALQQAELKFRNENLLKILNWGLDTWWFDRNWTVSIKTPFSGIPKESFGMYLYHDVTSRSNAAKAGEDGLVDRTLVLSNVNGIDNGNFNFAPDYSSHRYSVQWTGDIGQMSDSLKREIRNSVRSGAISSVPYVAPDVGGHYGMQSSELHTRWSQYAAFAPIFRYHSVSAGVDRSPWLYGETAEDTAREYIAMRYRLAPVYYALAHENYENGMPLLRRLDFNYPQYAESQDDTEYTVEDNILVAPLYEGGKEQPLPGEWMSANGRSGLYYEYFNNEELSGTPVKTGYEDEVYHSWGYGSPDGVNPDHFSARWTGTITLGDEDSRIAVKTDDGVRLYIDGVAVINNWSGTNNVTNVAPILLEAGSTHDIKLEYYEGTGEARMELIAITIPKDGDSREIFIPDGNWIDVWTGESYEGPRTITQSHGYSTSPLFVRSGTILPLVDNVEYLGQEDWRKVTLDVYPSTQLSDTATLYEDDTTSVNYKKGEFRTTALSTSYDKTAGEVLVNIGAVSDGSYAGSDAFDKRTWSVRVHAPEGWGELTGVTLDGKAQTAVKTEKSADASPFAISGAARDSDIHTLTFEKPIDEATEVRVKFASPKDEKLPENNSAAVDYSSKDGNIPAFVDLDAVGSADWNHFDGPDGVGVKGDGSGAIGKLTVNGTASSYEGSTTYAFGGDTLSNAGVAISDGSMTLDVSVGRVEERISLYVVGDGADGVLEVTDGVSAKVISLESQDGKFAKRIMIDASAKEAASLKFTLKKTGGDGIIALMAVAVGDPAAEPDTSVARIVTIENAVPGTDISVGTKDWVHLGLGGDTGAVNRKSGIDPVLSNPSFQGSKMPVYDFPGLSFSGGGPTASANGTQNAVTCYQGTISFSVPTSSQWQELKIYTGAYESTNTVKIYDEDGNVTTQTFSAASPTQYRVITVKFRSAGDSTLYIESSGTGHMFIAAYTLAEIDSSDLMVHINSVRDAVADIAVTADTSAEDILKAASDALTESAVSVAWAEPARITPATETDEGRITGKLRVSMNGIYLDVAVEVVLPVRSFVKGDVDDNGTVNVSDIMTLKNLIMSSSWTAAQLERGDMNNDGTLTVGDMLSIKSIIMAG